MRKLLVIIPDRLSVLVGKGEITDRYYNPGDLFDEVHILMTNDDEVSPLDVQKTVGRARVHIHNMPWGLDLLLKSLGFRPFLLKRWAETGLKLADSIRPDLIRCHGNRLNGYIAASIKAKMSVPYVLSMHTQPDENRRIEKKSFHFALRYFAEASIARIGIRCADIVLPVYESIAPYVRRLGARNVKVVYNVINPSHLHRKEDYTLSSPVRVLCVGRQYREKNPENIIKAIARLENTSLFLVGDGAYHGYLRKVADEHGVGRRVEFRKTVPNDELCEMLPEFDIFAAHSEYCGIPKAVMEPLLTGLPVIMNKRSRAPVPELQGNHLMLVDDSVEGYYRGIKMLIEDKEARELLGTRAFKYANALWSPAEMERRVAEIYEELLIGTANSKGLAGKVFL